MRVLQLYNRIPWPLHDGGALAVHSLSSGLHEAGIRLRMFALNPSRNYVAPNEIPQALQEDFGLQTETVDTRLWPHKAAFNLLGKTPFHISRFYRPKIAQKLKMLLQSEQFDLIQLEAPFVGCYYEVLRTYSKAPIVLRAHNVEYRIWERLAEGCQQPLKAWYLREQAARLKKFELQLIREVNGIVAISEVDATFFRQHTPAPISVIPTGIKLDGYRPIQPNECNSKRMHFLGSLDWQPNQEAAQWLATEIWPAIVALAPESRCQVAGKNFPAFLKALASPGLNMLGPVTDAHAFMRSHPLCLIPMRSGSGIRIKLLEALALGLPVISSTIGAEGIPVKHGKEILLANSPEEFAKCVLQLQKNEDFAFNLGQQGRAFIAAQYDSGALSKKLIDFYRQLGA
ncbi:MAG: glycosyltransferase family 4 protein [Bacteroidia bacterium]